MRREGSEGRKVPGKGRDGVEPLSSASFLFICQDHGGGCPFFRTSIKRTFLDGARGGAERELIRICDKDTTLPAPA
jgi:hypothetical protein